jgi:MEDS: MEthanogen/methylotroph, DcmR Sensory domain
LFGTGSIPIQFINSLEEKQHLMLFYEDREYARLIEFLFIKRGLEKGENCVYATHEDSGNIVIKLLCYGIPLDAFLSKKIQVLQMRPISGKHDEMISECKKEIIKLQEGLKRPFRIVSRIISDVSTIEGMSVEVELEKLTHDCFDDFGGSVMCPYDISEIEKTKKSEWIKDLYSSHHAIIYIPKYGEDGVICPIMPQPFDKYSL